MDERDGVEWPEQQFQYRQSLVKKNKSEIKQEKKMSKTESRFKSKFESLKKLQHSASTNSAVEKARAFFRSLELKHIGGGGSSNSDRSSSSSSRRRSTTTNNNNTHLSTTSSKVLLSSSISSSSSSSIIDDSHNTISTTTNDSSFYSKTPSNCIATARIIRVINPKDMIVHRVIHNEQDDHQLSSSYLNYRQNFLSQKNIQLPKQYVNERSQSYSVAAENHREVQTQYNSRPLPSVSSINPNITYSPQIYPNFPSSSHSILTNENILNHPISASLYDYRPLVCRQMESPSLMSSSFHEQFNRSIDPIIRPLPSSASSSSMSTWTQSVRRLNTEYTSTINALQQAKESLKQIYPNSTDTISKYANFVARGISNLSNDESKKSLGVTFCLTTSISQNSPPSSSSQITKTLPSNVFCKPKLIRALELDTFIPSIPPVPKLELVPNVIEKNDKTDSIANIIKKFNNLNNLPSTLKSSIIIDNNNSLSSQIDKEQRETSPKILLYDSIQSKKDLLNISPIKSTADTNPTSTRVRFEPSITTYELEDIPYESPPPPLTSSSSSSLASEDSTSSTTSINDENPPNPIQEETTFTVETFYKSTDDKKNNLLSNNQQVVIIRENTTEEQFNLAQEKQRQNQQISSQQKFKINETNVPPITTPLLTYLNLSVKQITPTPPTIEKQEKIHDNYHSVEPLSHITKDFISDIYHDENDETINDVITINPYTHSPPSHRLNSSSSSTSTLSSASTVLLSSSTNINPPISSSATKTPPTINGNHNKNNNKSISQLPKRTKTTTTSPNVSRLKQPSKVVSSSSKLKPPSSTIIKPIRSMIANSTSTVVATIPTTSSSSSMRKPTGIMNQSLTMTNNSVNKTTQQQSSSSLLPTAKKQQLVNGTNMTESQNPSDSSISLGKNRVRSMVNQLNAAVSSSPRPAIPSTIPAKRIPTTPSSTINSRRLASMEPTPSTNKTTITPSSRPSLQRAMTINNQSPIRPSPPSTPPTINNNNNISSSYKRKTPLIRSTSNVKEGLLRWCQAQVLGYPNVSITNLSSSWSDGLAFCALIHHFFPDAFDFNSLSSTNRKDNFELAFRIAEERAGVPQLLDVSDMLIMGNTPDYKCIFTYLNSFLAKVKDLHPTTNGVEHH